MSYEAARAGDKVSSGPTADAHDCTIGNTTTTSKCTFSATINENVSANVFIGDRAAATMDSVASKNVTHDPALPTTASSITPQPKTSGKITQGSNTVSINSLSAARHGDAAECCSATGTVDVQGTATVFIGG